MADAVFSACFLNACLRQSEHVQMACMAPVVNVRGPLFVHPRGIVKRTTLHVLKMYSDLLEAEVVECQVSSDPLKIEQESVACIDAVVTRSADRKRLAACVVNRHPSLAASVALEVGGPQRSVRTTTLSGDSPDAYNDVAHPARVVPQTREVAAGSGRIELPPHSVSVVQWGG